MDRILLQLPKLRQSVFRASARQLSPKLASPAAYGIAVLLAIAIGLAAATTFRGLGLMVFVPALSYVQSTRSRALVVAFAYYAAASNILVSSATAFFGPSTTPALTGALWLTSSALLASPYALLWSRERKQAIWRLPLAILSSVPPPLGLIGWASPLTAAGALYPGTGWVGLTAVLLAPGFLVTKPVPSGTALAVGVLIAAATSPGDIPSPEGWEAVSTSLQTATTDPLQEYAIHHSIQQRLHTSDARVTIFAETVVPVWTEATEALWRPTVRKLTDNDQTAVFGTTLPIPNSDRFRNVLVVQGAVSGVFDQHIPVPIGMWRPLLSTGVPLNLSGPTVLRIGSERVAPLICYEQFLTLPILRAAAADPTGLLAVSNIHWSGSTSLSALQQRLSSSWARLFRLKSIVASNT